MTIFNVGSINADYFYEVPHLPHPGETVPATRQTTGLGGKGANQSVAAARAGAHVVHVGAVGPEGGWAVDRLAKAGVGVDHIARLDTPTGHAIITVEPGGENAIVTFAGANAAVSQGQIDAALASAGKGDVLILQNESPNGAAAARIARGRGMFVAYSAAPFVAEAAVKMVPLVDLMIVNAVEAAQLCDAMGLELAQVPVPNLLITKGAQGAEWRERGSGDSLRVAAFDVVPVDTTGAGDCFAGYLIAGLNEGMSPGAAMRLAAAASAIKVTRHGTADAIPTRDEVAAFLQDPANGAADPQS